MDRMFERQKSSSWLHSIRSWICCSLRFSKRTIRSAVTAQFRIWAGVIFADGLFLKINNLSRSARRSAEGSSSRLLDGSGRFFLIARLDLSLLKASDVTISRPDVTPTKLSGDKLSPRILGSEYMFTPRGPAPSSIVSSPRATSPLRERCTSRSLRLASFAIVLTDGKELSPTV